MNKFENATSEQKAFWDSLFNAKSIAVIGANASFGTWGYDALKSALGSLQTDPCRQIYAVNPNATEVQGLKTYASVLDIPGVVELAVIVVRADIVPSVMRQCAQKKVKAAVIISAGFGEVDEAGIRMQADIVETARQAGMHFVGPNCIGHGDVHTKVASTGIAGRTGAGPMALITQSGTVGGSIVQKAASRGIGISKFISTGNEADMHFEDYLEYLAGDLDTRVITAYIEGLREGRRFFELAKKITPHKPIIVVKTGTTSQSSRAAKSHTGALAGSDAVYSAAFKQAGVIRAEDDEELCDIALSFLNSPLPKGNRVGILTMGGGFGVITAEACEKEGLQLATLDPETLAKMDKVLPPRWPHANPVDLAGVRSGGEDSTGDTCLRLLMEDPNIDILISLLPQMPISPEIALSLPPEQLKKLQEDNQRHIEFMHQQVREQQKPLILLRFSGQPANTAATTPPAVGADIPSYSDPRRAVRVMRHLVWYHRFLEYNRAQTDIK